MSDELQKSSPERQGFIYALRLLAVSKKSSEELRTRLIGKGYSSETVKRVLADLAQKKMLSDVKFTEETLEQMRNVKQFGSYRIKQELMRRGVARELINQALNTISKEDERAIACQVAHDRWNKLNKSKIDLSKRKRRVYQYLVSRGYDFELSQQIVQALSYQTR